MFSVAYQAFEKLCGIGAHRWNLNQRGSRPGKGFECEARPSKAVLGIPCLRVKAPVYIFLGKNLR